MVTWRRAIQGALSTLLWSIVWAMVGLAVMVMAALFGGMRIVEGPFGLPYLRPDPALMIPAMILGVFVIGVGWMAAFYKIHSEITGGVRGGGTGEHPQGQELLVCPLCGAENQPGAKFCRNCGAAIKR